jgi:hypothetical protein
LQDWPPQKDFRTQFPEFFDDFQRAVPFADETTLNGVLNFAAHLAMNGVVPDMGASCYVCIRYKIGSIVYLIGPKMYNANGGELADDIYGSTKLHMDLTDAVNVMVWAANCRDGSPGYALWHIFLPEAAEILRRFFEEEGFVVGSGDLIHLQNIYVHDGMLKRLADKYNIRPYTIRQYTNQAVFIPAGCPHQVCYVF